MAINYYIETVQDFTEVPIDRLDECLADFKIYLEMFDTCKKEAQFMTPYPKFKWIDDGERVISEITFRVNRKEKP